MRDCRSDRNEKTLLQPGRPFVHDGLRDRLDVVGGGAGVGDEAGAAVVLELADGLEDVGEGAVAAVLLGALK